LDLTLMKALELGVLVARELLGFWAVRRSKREAISLATDTQTHP